MCGNHILLPVWNKMFSLSIIRENNIQFQEGISFNEDFLFVMDFLGKAKKICVHNKILLHYWIEEVKESLSSQRKLEDIMQSGQMLSKSINTLKMKKETKKKMNYELCNHLLIPINSIIRECSKEDKVKILKEVREEAFFIELLKNIQISQVKKKIKIGFLKLKWYRIYLLIAERGVNK